MTVIPRVEQRGRITYFYTVAKLCLMQPRMSLAIFPARLHCWLMISLFSSSFACPAKLLSSGHPQAYAAPQEQDFACLFAELQVPITLFLYSFKITV